MVYSQTKQTVRQTDTFTMLLEIYKENQLTHVSAMEILLFREASIFKCKINYNLVFSNCLLFLPFIYLLLDNATDAIAFKNYIPPNHGPLVLLTW